ncbi:HPr kinase/phosphatase C-terminal domain-containing protein [Vannielia litorea]|uniref:HPr kinase/phosphorylase n=1 Tax=Vannielia litorea TaxID=1217970 RepID=UPI001C955218|nr:HPr kinase/phosphatase C-terminal domain-containing protein [Vannielia litorea]MBY6155270.1 HPr kinase/phosphatase C-terminal domain-containing protein [Vannielia litorea]
MAGPQKTEDPFFHASAVAFGARGVLILGPSGAGKSALAVELVSRGGRLVGDDRLMISGASGVLTARPRPGFEGQIECRGVGLLNVPSVSEAEIALVVDAGRVERDRLPPAREIFLFGCSLPLLHRAEGAQFPAAVQLMLTGSQINSDLKEPPAR